MENIPMPSGSHHHHSPSGKNKRTGWDTIRDSVLIVDGIGVLVAVILSALSMYMSLSHESAVAALALRLENRQMQFELRFDRENQFNSQLKSLKKAIVKLRIVDYKHMMTCLDKKNVKSNKKLILETNSNRSEALEAILLATGTPRKFIRTFGHKIQAEVACMTKRNFLLYEKTKPTNLCPNFRIATSECKADREKYPNFCLIGIRSITNKEYIDSLQKSYECIMTDINNRAEIVREKLINPKS